MERDTSGITAMQALAVLRETDFDVTPVYIAADGGFYADGVDEVSAFTPFDASRHKRLVLADGVFSEMRKGKLKRVFRPDAALVCCHGGEGENGVLQGVLEFNGVPYTSAGVLGSALMMDKAAAKCAFEQMLLNVLPYVVVGSQEVEADADGAAERCEEALGLPVIVKPASQGSSIGISAAHDRGELSSVLAFAAKFGEKLVVEQLLEDFAEVNCAAYGRGEEVVVSETERPLSSGELLTFDDKYLSGGKAGSGRVTPADVGEEMNALIGSLTERIYRALGLRGVVRMDFLADRARGKVYINEVNTVPGSMAFYLFEAAGVSFSDILTDIIEDAIARGRAAKRTAAFPSRVLEFYGKGGAKTAK